MTLALTLAEMTQSGFTITVRPSPSEGMCLVTVERGHSATQAVSYLAIATRHGELALVEALRDMSHLVERENRDSVTRQTPRASTRQTAP